MEIPDPQYLETHDGAYIAYQAVGEGPIDIAWQVEFVGNLDVWWQFPWIGRWFEGLASYWPADPARSAGSGSVQPERAVAEPGDAHR